MSSEDGSVLSATPASASDTANTGEGGSNNRQTHAAATPVVNNSVGHGFRMQIQQAPTQQQHRSRKKRKRDTSAGALDSMQTDQSMRLSSSSSSSSDEDEETKQHPSSSGVSSGSGSQQQPEADKQQMQRVAQTGSNRKDKQKETTALVGDKEKGSSDSDSAKPTADIQSQPAHHQQPQQPEGWRVKLYRLNADGSWDDCGTGRILCLYKPSTKGEGGVGSHSNSSLGGDAWIYQELREPTLCMHSEVPATGSSSAPRILLRTRILLRDAYQRQGDNIITWCEPYLEEGNPAQGVDLALSFQDNAGCLDIWRQITQVQSRAADIYRRNGGAGGGGERVGSSAGNVGNKSITTSKGVTDGGTQNGEDIASNGTSNSSSVTDVAHAVAAAHHADLQRQQQQEMWVNVASQAAQHHLDQQNAVAERHNQDHHFEDAVGGMVAAYHEANTAPASTPNTVSPQLPNPPSLANLEEIADMIAAVQVGGTTDISGLACEPMLSTQRLLLLAVFTRSISSSARRWRCTYPKMTALT